MVRLHRLVAGVLVLLVATYWQVAALAGDVAVPVIPAQFSANLSVADGSRAFDVVFRWSDVVHKPRASFAYYLHGTATPILERLLANDLLHAFNISASGCTSAWLTSTTAGLLSWVNPAQAQYVGQRAVDGVQCDLFQNADMGAYLCAVGNVPVQLGVPGFEFNFSSFTPGDQESFLDVPDSCKLPARFPTSPPFGLYDGFETDAIGPFWIPGGEKYQRYVEGHVTVQSEVVRSGKYAANITVQPGDIKQGNSERDELDSRTWAVLDEDIWYGWSQYLPKDFPIVDDRLVMGQWKQADLGDVSPLFAQRFRSGMWEFTVTIDLNSSTKASFPMPKLQFGVWHDMVFQMRFSRNSSGYFRVWHNGTQVVNYAGRTAQLQAGSDAFYNKFGLYRDLWPTSWTVYFDNYSIGRSFDEVDPAKFAANHPPPHNPKNDASGW